MLDWGVRYVNAPEPEVDKKALLADREKLSLEQLSEAGIRCEQDELFYITPKSEVAARTVLEAVVLIWNKVLRTFAGFTVVGSIR
jgi:hypothetical protein